MFIIVLFSLLSLAWAGDFCRTRSSVYTSTYCVYGCCDEYTYNPCCTLSGAAIAGIVIAVIFVIALIVVLMICRRRHIQRTQIVYSNTAQPHIISTSTGTANVAMGAPQPYYAAPAPYGQPTQGYGQTFAPPPYTEQKPAGAPY